MSYPVDGQASSLSNVEKLERLRSLGVAVSPETFLSRIDGSWDIVNSNNSMGWRQNQLSGHVIFIDRSVYIVGDCVSTARGHPGGSRPFSIEYDQSTDLLTWDTFYKVPNASLGNSPAEIKFDVSNRQVLIKIRSDVRDSTGDRIIAGAFVVAGQ